MLPVFSPIVIVLILLLVVPFSFAVSLAVSLRQRRCGKERYRQRTGDTIPKYPRKHNSS
jgi:steroid 5-alpha reductase family enzyme